MNNSIGRSVFAVAVLAVAAIGAGCCKKPVHEVIDLTAQARAAAEASGLALGSVGVEGATLRIYTWSDYVSGDVLDSFERALGVKVEVETFDSNETMFERLKTEGSRYDLIMPSSYQIAAMVREGMVEPLDRRRLPNVRQNFEPSFASQILDPSFTYSVPYAVTYTGLAYRKDRLGSTMHPGTWSVLGEEELCGRISLLNDMREVIGAALMRLGYSVNSTDRDEIARAASLVIKWRDNVRSFDTEGYKGGLACGDTWLAQGYSTDITQLIAGDKKSSVPPRADIGFALPREGFTVAFDEMVLASGAKNKDLVYAFINYMYDGDVAAANMNYMCGTMPVAPGIALLDDDYRELIVLDDAQMRNGQLLRSFDDRPDVQKLYETAWDLIKATAAE